METMEKTQKFVQLKKLAGSVISYWSIVPIPVEEKLSFMPLLQYDKADSVDDIPEHREDFIKDVENECDRLEKLVADLISRKKSKLETSDIYVAFQLVKEQISIAKAHCIERQDIVTRVELLQSACDEIGWYVSPDFNASSIEDQQRVARGKVLVDFFPKVLEDLEEKVTSWNLKENNQTFLFDGVDVGQRIEALKTYYAERIITDMDAVPEGIDIHQLAVPRRLRTPRVPVEVNVPLPLQPQVLPPPPEQQPQLPPLPPPPPPPLPSDGDDSMASSGSKSDSKDSDYNPSGSDASE